MSRIISIGTSVPLYRTRQSTILGFMQDAYASETASRKLNLLFHYSGISTRYSTIADFDRSEGKHVLFNGNGSLPKVSERLSVFKENAVPLAISAIQNAVTKLDTTVHASGITHLITVTCTGLYAPGIDAEIIEQLNLPDDIFHTAINFLGCNAAFHALRLSDAITRSDENAKVLIVCVELCTLHFQPKDNNDNLLSNTLFGDGAAAVIVTGDKYAIDHKFSGLTINGFYSRILNKGRNLMGWYITPVNFEMILDSRVPEFISSEITDLLRHAAKQFGIQPGDIHKWAIHPGGKKILDAIRKQLQLSEKDLQYSYRILDEYGNMSSPTVLFVINEIGKAELYPDKRVMAIGFGPGLSIETALLTYAQ